MPTGEPHRRCPGASGEPLITTPATDRAKAALDSLRDDHSRQGGELDLHDVLRTVARRHLTPEEESWLWQALEHERLFKPEGSATATAPDGEAERPEGPVGESRGLAGDARSAFMRQLGDVPKLSDRETAELIRLVQTRSRGASRIDEERVAHALDRLLRANLRFVVFIARPYFGMCDLDAMELIQEGVCGFLKAVDRFDVTRGTSLRTYAGWWIRQTVVRAAQNIGRTVRLPVHVQERANRVRKARHRLERERGRRVTLAEVAYDLNMDVSEAAFLLDACAEIQSLDAALPGADDLTLGDTLVRHQASPEDVVARKWRAQRLAQALSSLKPQERAVIQRRFGLVDGVSATLQEIGDAFGLTRERIRQIESKALERLRRVPEVRALWSLAA